MNCRIALKVLTCKSSLHHDTLTVIRARQMVRDNPKYFKKKGLYLFPESDEDVPALNNRNN